MELGLRAAEGKPRSCPFVLNKLTGEQRDVAMTMMVVITIITAWWAL